MNDWFIRISRPYDEIKEWVEWLPCEKKCAVQHDADEEVSRTHTHILVIGCSLQKLSVKTKLERILGSKPAATDWSFKEPDDDNYRKMCVYLSKGKYEYSMLFGFDYDWKIIKSEWVEPNQLQLTMRNYKTFKNKKDIATQKDLIDRVIILCESDNDVSLDNVLSKIRQVFIEENRCIVGRYKTRDIVDTIMARTNPLGWQNSLKLFCQFKS